LRTAVEAFLTVRSPVKNGLSLSSTSVAGHQVGGFGVGAGQQDGGHAHHVGRQARGDQFLAAGFAGGHQHLAAHVAALLDGGQLVFEVHARAPAAIMFFISSKAFSTPPKPASASATMGRK
jgi:hypothetical protein